MTSLGTTSENDYSAVISEIASKIWEGIEPRAYAFSGEAVTSSPTFALPENSQVQFKFRATVDNGPFVERLDNITHTSNVTGSFGTVGPTTSSIAPRQLMLNDGIGDLDFVAEL